MNNVFAGRIAGYLDRFERGKAPMSWLIVSMLCSIRKVEMKSDVDSIRDLVFRLTESRNIPIEQWKQACVCLLARKDDRWELAEVDRLLRIAGVDKHYQLRRSVAQAVIAEWSLGNDKVNALAKWGSVQLMLVPTRGTPLRTSAASH